MPFFVKKIRGKVFVVGVVASTSAAPVVVCAAAVVVSADVVASVVVLPRTIAQSFSIKNRISRQRSRFLGHRAF